MARMVIFRLKGQSMRNVKWFLLVGVVLFVASIAGACQARQSEPPQPAPAQPAYTTTATVKDLMLSIIDPSADVVWNSVTTAMDSKLQSVMTASV